MAPCTNTNRLDLYIIGLDYISNTWAFQATKSLIDLSHVNGDRKKERDREGKSNIRKQMERGVNGGNSR